MNRIVIIGCPGAGKTTFSRKLADKLKLPLVHLDFYYHDSKHDYENNKDEWRTLIKSLVNKDKWIIEGNYKSTFELRLPRADTIIYFDFPKTVSVYRTLKRRVQYRNKLRPEMPADWREKIDPKFMKFVWNFNKTERPLIYDQLANYNDENIVILKNPEEVKNFLDSLEKVGG